VRNLVETRRLFSGFCGYSATMPRIISTNLLLLDLNLPDADGLQLAKQLNQQLGAPKILMMTSRSEVEDRWSGFKYM
jgi:DNA-binding response OmpR family regulator